MPKVAQEIELPLNDNTFLRARAGRVGVPPERPGGRRSIEDRVEFTVVVVGADKKEERFSIEAAEAHAIAAMMRAGAQ